MSRFLNRLFNSATLLLIATGALAAEDAPRPPCGGVPNPPYAALGAQPNVKVWNDARHGVQLGSSCAGVPAGEAKMVLALAGAFRFGGDADKLLERVGAVSKMQGIRYWSVTDGKWRELITDSAAVDSRTSGKRRPDYTVAELRDHKDVFFVQRDSRSTGEVFDRMRLLEDAKDRIVVETENVSPVRTYIFTLFKPGELRNIHYLTRVSDAVWHYYSLTIIGAAQSGSHEPSLINRAAAIYRYIAGQPTDQAPALAP